MIKFLLNCVEQQIEQLDPNTSVLDYLRDHLKRSGTKEGCASGDCGACTVVVVDESAGQLRYQAINACITPLATLHGKQLLTVEDLQQGEQLHPVQQAMVDCHGSQCGFCTPGFVMSMFAYRKNHSEADRESLGEALGGNLCRCTGYRPILDAGVQMFTPASEDSFSHAAGQTLALLQTLAENTGDIALSGAGRHYLAPRSLKQLSEALAANPQARLLAGGTDLCLEMTQNLQDIDQLIFTGEVAELTQVHETEQELIIGAAVTYSQCRDRLCAEYPDLAELIDRLGSRQIRNRGTLAGNVANASPIADMPPVLIALGAELTLRKGSGSRLIAVEDYYRSYKVTALEPGEFIENIIIPKAQAADSFSVYKVSKRLEDDISAVCGAFLVRVEQDVVTGARIAYGGMAEIPKRARHCEQALINQPWNQATIDTAMQALALDYQPIDDFRASAAYRQQVAANLLQRLLLASQLSADNLRVTHYA